MLNIEQAPATLINNLVEKMKEDKINVKNHVRSVYFLVDENVPPGTIGLSGFINYPDGRAIVSNIKWGYDGFTAEDAIVLCRVYAEKIWRGDKIQEPKKRQPRKKRETENAVS